MTPVEALQRIVHCLDRAHVTGFKTKAWVRALDVVMTTDPAELEERARAGTLTELPGIGDSTARVIREAIDGEVPAYLTKLEAETVIEMTPRGRRLPGRAPGRLPHPLHVERRRGQRSRTWRRTAIALGHEYMVLTDHSARLTIAHGLDRERLLAQLDDLAVLNERLAPFRILTGMEVDILEDGQLDLDDELLARLDVVVASVHSKLRMERPLMTQRMVLAAASPHVDILGHCTGRLIGKRPQSVFDADYVFAACARFGTAVEINSRPERLDPPKELLDLALSYGCFISIDSDAHATGQLEWQPHGCDKAAQSAVPVERVINTWPIEDLLAWTETSEAA